MFWRRALVFFTLGPLTLLLVYLGGWFYFIPFAGLLIVASIEFSHLGGKLGWRIPLLVLIPSVIAQWFLPLEVQEMLFGGSGLQVDLASTAMVLSLLVIMGYALWLFERKDGEDAAGSWMAGVGGFIVLGWLGSYFFQLRAFGETGMEWTIAVMVGIWIADSGAYVIGKTLGRHKLAPKLSPNKTLEGYFGGVLFGTVATLLLAMLFDLNLWTALLIGLTISILSPLGDLGVSMLKRTVGVKDSGNFLPGHGGALDRTDSLLWGVVLAYYLLQLTS
ncbi:MAG: phosphatidate cytidylyltransferase [Anaerolineae bacterium]|nr:MAG: phosphatidate cytidylyltransferase [Anaerolineae bacterium]